MFTSAPQLSLYYLRNTINLTEFKLSVTYEMEDHKKFTQLAAYLPLNSRSDTKKSLMQTMTTPCRTPSTLVMSLDGGRSILKMARPRRSVASSSFNWASCCLMLAMISNAFVQDKWLPNGPLAWNSSNRAVTCFLNSSLDDSKLVLNLS